MREAWRKRQEQDDPAQSDRTEADPETAQEIEEPQSLADRLREAAKGIDQENATAAVERVTSMREGREAEERQKVEQEREVERQRQQELERSREYDRGMDFDM